MIKVEAIPYKNFKEKIRLTKDLVKNVKPDYIRVYDSYIYIEIGGDTNDRSI